MPTGVAVPVASSSFRFRLPHLRVMSATTVSCRGGYNSDDITKVRVGGWGGLLSQEAVMTE